jgi:AraC-like DNA-binding protein
MHAIRLLRPAPQLREYIRYYAERRVRLHDAVVVHPAPARAASVLEFVFGDPIKVLAVEKLLEFASPRTVVVGMQTRCNLQLHLQGTLDCFVVLFQPSGLHDLFSVPMHELTDHSYEAHSVLGPLVSRLEQRLGECTTFEGRVRVADEYLSRRAVDVPGLRGTSAAARQILLSGGNIRVAALAGNAGLSVRQFERGFLQHVGMRPKLFARIARFEAALDGKARSASKSWTDVAHEFGYYDQMHMVHDFEEFTGETPKNTLSQLELLFQSQVQALRSSQHPANGLDGSRLIL